MLWQTQLSNITQRVPQWVGTLSFTACQVGFPSFLQHFRSGFLLAFHVLFCSACIGFCSCSSKNPVLSERFVAFFSNALVPVARLAPISQKFAPYFSNALVPFDTWISLRAQKRQCVHAALAQRSYLGLSPCAKKDMFMQKHCCGEQTWTERDVPVKRLHAAPR